MSTDESLHACMIVMSAMEKSISLVNCFDTEEFINVSLIIF